MSKRMDKGMQVFYMTCIHARDWLGGRREIGERLRHMHFLQGSHSTGKQHPHDTPATTSGTLAVYGNEFFYISENWECVNHEWPLAKQTECWPDSGSVDQSFHLTWA